MNFLSHFYFERKNTDDYIVMGVVLPDLIKNADKNWNLNPQKDEYLFTDVPGYNSLLTGWKRHLEVDRLFLLSFLQGTDRYPQTDDPACGGNRTCKGLFSGAHWSGTHSGSTAAHTQCSGCSSIL
jgi:hypothetical protein